MQETVDGPDICPEPYANGTCGWATNDFMAALALGHKVVIIQPSKFSIKNY